MILSEREQYQLLRKRKGIKLKDLSKDIGCSIGLLSMYENGKIDLKQELRSKYIQYINRK